MGLQTLESVCRGLMAEGVDPATPAAVVSRGTLAGQQVVVAELGRLADDAARLPGPALVVVGEVVALRARLLGEVLQHYVS